MKKSRTFFAIASIIALIIVCFTAMPFLFLGAPLPLYSINNNDVMEHKVVIEIFDMDNNSVFKNEYDLAPDTEVSQSKPVWLLLKLSFPPGGKEEYEFKVTLDDNLTEEFQRKVQVWNIADIEIYDTHAEYPISVDEKAV
jgi:hypothetical protein